MWAQIFNYITYQKLAENCIVSCWIDLMIKINTEKYVVNHIKIESMLNKYTTTNNKIVLNNTLSYFDLLILNVCYF